MSESLLKHITALGESSSSDEYCATESLVDILSRDPRRIEKAKETLHLQIRSTSIPVLEEAHSSVDAQFSLNLEKITNPELCVCSLSVLAVLYYTELQFEISYAISRHIYINFYEPLGLKKSNSAQELPKNDDDHVQKIIYEPHSLHFCENSVFSMVISLLHLDIVQQRQRELLSPPNSQIHPDGIARLEDFSPLWRYTDRNASMSSANILREFALATSQKYDTIDQSNQSHQHAKPEKTKFHAISDLSSSHVAYMFNNEDEDEIPEDIWEASGPQFSSHSQSQSLEVSQQSKKSLFSLFGSSIQTNLSKRISTVSTESNLSSKVHVENKEVQMQSQGRIKLSSIDNPLKNPLNSGNSGDNVLPARKGIITINLSIPSLQDETHQISKKLSTSLVTLVSFKPALRAIFLALCQNQSSSLFLYCLSVFHGLSVIDDLQRELFSSSERERTTLKLPVNVLKRFTTFFSSKEVQQSEIAHALHGLLNSLLPVSAKAFVEQWREFHHVT